VSYSQGFRSGAPQDELVGSVIGYYPPVKPDKLTNYEAGVKGTLWNQLLSYDVAVYYMKWQDIQQQVLVPFSLGYVYVQVNGNSASGHGADFSLKSHPFTGLTLGAEFSWNTMHFDSTVYSGGAILFPEGSRPNFSPEYTAGVSAQYGFPLGGGGFRGVISASGNYVSPLNTTFVDKGLLQGNSQVLTYGTFAIETPDHWTVGLFVKNANDWNGRQVSYGTFDLLSPREQPRTYGLQFDYHLRK
jgi:outer membrane receptor protein involved in Fe transport